MINLIFISMIVVWLICADEVPLPQSFMVFDLCVYFLWLPTKKTFDVDITDSVLGE